MGGVQSAFFRQGRKLQHSSEHIFELEKPGKSSTEAGTLSTSIPLVPIYSVHTIGAIYIYIYIKNLILLFQGTRRKLYVTIYKL